MSGLMEAVGNLGSQLGQGNVGQGLSGFGNYLGFGSGQPAQGSLAQLLGQFAPVGGLAAAIPNFIEQNNLRNKLMDPGKLLGQVPPGVLANITQNTEAATGPVSGSSQPQAMARGISAGVSDYQLQFLNEALQSLFGAAGMFPPAGSLEQMIAQATGGLGGQYSQFTGFPGGVGSTGPNGYPIPFTGDSSNPFGLMNTADPGVGPMQGTF